MFKNPFSFKGRIRRTEYGVSIIIYISYLLLIFIILGSTGGGDGSILFLPMFIPAGWFMFAQGAKRCHDLGNSGFFMLIPFYGLWMLFASGNIGTNSYGLDPKTNFDMDEIDEIGSHLTD